MERQCLYCHNNFVLKYKDKKNWKQKYCSRTCANKAISSSEKCKNGLSSRMRGGQASAMGKLSRHYENKIATTLNYEHLFLPNEVCDRIAIDNGNIIFVEIKQKGQALRKKQEEFRRLVPNLYKIVEG